MFSFVYLITTYLLGIVVIKLPRTVAFMYNNISCTTYERKPFVKKKQKKEILDKKNCF